MEGAGPWRVGAGPLGHRRRLWSKWAAVVTVGGWRYSNPLEVTLRTPAIVISRAAKDLLLCIPFPIAEICQQTKFVLSYCLV